MGTARRVDVTHGVLLFIFLVLSFIGPSKGTCYSPESCLHESLFTNYDSHVRPAVSPDDVITINTSLYIRALSGINEKEEIMDLVGFLRLEWIDHFLHWDSQSYNGTQYLILFAEDIWLPDVVIANSAEDYYKSTYKEDFRIVVGSDGYVQWSFGGTFHTSCSLDISEYPFDSQKCHIEVENFLYPKIMVDLKLGKPSVGSKGYENSGLWNLYKVKGKIEKYKNNGLAYPRVRFTFKWERKTLYYSFNIILPTLFITLITLGSFWLPPTCGEKISLGITVLLAFSVFQIIIMDNTPVNSDVTPRISKVVIFVMSMATISLINAMLTVHIEGKSDATRAPRWLRTVAFQIVARVFFLRAEIPEIAEESQVEPEIESIGGKEEKTKETSSYEHAQILAHLELYTSHIKAKQRSENVTDEWKLIAKLVDRLLFWICLLITLIYVFYTLGVILNKDKS